MFNCLHVHTPPRLHLLSTHYPLLSASAARRPLLIDERSSPVVPAILQAYNDHLPWGLHMIRQLLHRRLDLDEPWVTELQFELISESEMPEVPRLSANKLRPNEVLACFAPYLRSTGWPFGPRPMRREKNGRAF